MKRAAPISLLLSILFLAPTIFTVLPASASTQLYQSTDLTIEIVSWGPTSVVVGQTYPIYVRVTIGGQPASAQVTFYENSRNLGTAFTDNTGLAQYTVTAKNAGTYTLSVDAFVKITGQTVEKSWTETISGAATPTPQQPTATPSVATPTPTPTAKPTPTPTPTPQQPGTIIYVPPIIVIINVFPGTITQGTGPWGGPRITVKNPGPDKLRTTLLDFASNPEDNTAHYNEQVNFANTDGWKLTARGEKTYGDHSKDYRYSRFTKGTSTLLLAAQGNNSTDKQYNIPGDVLITEQDETFSSGTAFSLFGLEGLAAYAVVAVIAIAILALIVVGVLYYRRKDTGSEQQRYYPPR